jgi:hypothetical protein
MNAAKGKNLSPAALTVLRLVLFLVVALLLPKTRVWGFEAAPQHASGKIAFASASATGEIALALAYDASGCPVTLNSGAGDGITFSNQTVDGPLGNSGITTVAKDSPTELPQPSGAGDYQPDQSLLQEFTGENMGPTTPEDYNVQIGSPEEEDAAESAFINNVPGLGLAKNSIEAITGNDLITGKPIDPNTAFENILNGAVTTTLTLGGGPEAGGESELMGVADTAVNTAGGTATQLEFNFANEFGQNSGLVIGRGADLAAPGTLGPGEYKLGWFSVQGTSGMDAEWSVNQMKLQNVMNLNLPIRDASSLLDTGGFYLNQERGLLQSAGWTYQGGSWLPPVP